MQKQNTNYIITFYNLLSCHTIYAILDLLQITQCLSISVIYKGFLCPSRTLTTLYQVFQDILLQEATEPIAVPGKGDIVHTLRYS